MEIGTIEILTGDHADAATALARRLGISGRGGLLPDEKLAVVQEYQRRKLTVAMIGDGTNDVLALAGADAGIAIGATGVAVASQAADLVLLRDDWMLVPDAIAMARRTMRLVRMNLAGSVLYNLVAVTLALSGHVTPVFAAAAHTIPDLGVLANSARLMRNPGRAGGGST
jgi:Cd2+/Zn2+-exporting ATPase/Cu+-exporting ATPase